MKRRQKEKQRGKKSNHRQSRFGRVHLPLQKQRDRAMMIRGIRVRVNQLVKRFGGRKKQERKKERETRHSPGAAKCLIAKRQLGYRFSHCGDKYMPSVPEGGKRFLAFATSVSEACIRLNSYKCKWFAINKCKLFSFINGSQLHLFWTEYRLGGAMSGEKYIQRLREHGHRVTPKVRAVLDLFLEHGSVLGPFEVRDRLQKRFKGVGLPTVYRILEGLANCGILLTAPNEDRQLRYFICRGMESGHHHHFICLNCGKVEEVNLCLMEKVEQYVKRHLKAKVQNHLLQIEGLCAKCDRTAATVK